MTNLNRWTLPLVTTLACAATCAAQSLEVSPDAVSLRGAEVGKLHDEALQHVADAGWTTTLPMDADAYASLLLLADEAGAGRAIGDALKGSGLTPLQIRQVTDEIERQIVVTATDVARSSGAVSSPGAAGAKTSRDMERAMIDECVGRRWISPELGRALEDFLDAAAASRSRGELESAAAHYLGGNRWSGWDRIGADAGLSVLRQSLDYWESVRRDRCDGEPTAWRSFFDLRDTAAADAVGGVIGGVVGGVGAAASLLVIGSLFPELAPWLIAGAPKAIGGGAAAGGALVGAGASAIMAAVPPPNAPSAPGPSPGGNGSSGDADTGDCLQH